jgi:SAM-dependent methyltransferase
MSSNFDVKAEISPDQLPQRLRTRACGRCLVCGSPGIQLYNGLHDHLFGVQGEWAVKRCSDGGCGLLWLDPMPIEEDIAMAYQHYYTHRDNPELHSSLALRMYHLLSEGYLASKYGYGREAIGWWQKALGLMIYLHPPQRSNLDFSVMYLPAKPGGRVLEVGCGAGKNLVRLQELGWQCEGVDVDGAAVQNACAKGLNVHQGTLEDRHFSADHFDAIISSHVIEHVHDPRSFLLECRRVLRSGGTFIAVTPNSSSLAHSMFRANWRGLEPPRHLHLFNRDSIQNLVRKAGFTEANIDTTMHGANWIFAASEGIAAKRGVGGWRVPDPLKRPWANGMQFVEWFRLKSNPSIGEELLLVARK